MKKFCCKIVGLLLGASLILCGCVNKTSQITSSTNDNQTVTESEAVKNLSNDPEIATAYINHLKNGGEFGDVNFAGYYIYDVDKDGCEEILINAGTCEADAVLWFYKYTKDGIVQIDNVPGGNASCSVCGNSKGEGVIVHYGTQGVENINKVTIKENGLDIEEIVHTREVSEYTEFEYCIPLTYYSINDMSPLEKFGGEDNSKTNFEKHINIYEFEELMTNAITKIYSSKDIDEKDYLIQNYKINDIDQTYTQNGELITCDYGPGSSISLMGIGKEGYVTSVTTVFTSTKIIDTNNIIPVVISLMIPVSVFDKNYDSYDELNSLLGEILNNGTKQVEHEEITTIVMGSLSFSLTVSDLMLGFEVRLVENDYS